VGNLRRFQKAFLVYIIIAKQNLVQYMTTSAHTAKNPYCIDLFDLQKNQFVILSI
jgi:hypothetical protein